MPETEDLRDRNAVGEFLATRSERAFRRIYQRHAPAVYGLLLRLTGGDASLAQDLMQEAWIRAVDGLAGFAWRSSLGSWLGGITVNCWREWLRAGRRDALLLAADDDALPAEAPDISPLDGLALAAAVAGLPPGYRTVLVLHDIEGYGHEDIARLLGIAPGTSKSQLARARHALRRTLQ